jgi:hypothetical protein
MPTIREIQQLAAINRRLAFIVAQRQKYQAELEALMGRVDIIADAILARPAQP